MAEIADRRLFEFRFETKRSDRGQTGSNSDSGERENRSRILTESRTQSQKQQALLN